MFSFLNPLFLWAAAAAVIPLLLHLLQRRRTIRIPFSTLRFLKLAQKRSANRVRLENLLLWLLRTAVVLCLVAAFALPVLRAAGLGALAGRTHRDVAIVWDASYSMGYASGARRVWDEARAAAESILEGLAEGDRVCLFLAADDVVPLVEQPTGDRELVRTLLRKQAPRSTSSQLLPATLAACAALAQSGRRERELYILTDGQALPWTSFAEASAPGGGGDAAAGAPPAAAWEPKRWEEGTAFFVAALGAQSPENADPRAVTLESPVVLAGQPARAAVEIQRTGAARPLTVALVVDGAEAARRELPTGADRLELTLPPLTSGVHQAYVETPEDNLAADNRLYFLVRARQKLPVLVAGSEADAFFLTRALNPVGDRSAIEVRRVEPAALAGAELAGSACVFLCNALPLPAQAILRLEQYVRDGGLLALFPGERAAPADYEPWGCLPAKPAGFDEIDAAAGRRLLRLASPPDPLFAAMRLPPGTVPEVFLRRALRWGPLEPKAAAVVTAGELPFLLGREFGKGRVLVFAVAADRRWSSLPLSPFFLPFVHQIVQYGAGAVREPLYVEGRRNLLLEDTGLELTEQARVLTPGGETRSIRPLKGAGQTALTLEDATEPGVYAALLPGAEAARPLLAVNLPRAESDLAPANLAALPRLTGLKGLRSARDREGLLRLIDEQRVGRPLAEPLLWLAFLLALLEVLLANWLTRRAPTLRDRLRVEPSGRVRGAPPAAEGAA